MSLDKSIKHGKERRKPYYGSKRFDCSCRNHGSCGYCAGNRLIQFNKEDARTTGQIDDYFGYWFQADEVEASTDHIDGLYAKLGIDTWRPIKPQLDTTYTASYDKP